MEFDSNILVLGVGNPLAGDDGLGPAIVHRLNSAFRFPGNVTVIDIGPNILAALEQIAGADKLLIVDAVLDDAPPGTVISRRIEENHVMVSSGQHQIGIEELLHKIENLCGHKPQAALVGIVPREIVAWSDRLSETVMNALPEAIEKITAQLREWGARPLPTDNEHLQENQFRR